MKLRTTLDIEMMQYRPDLCNCMEVAEFTGTDWDLEGCEAEADHANLSWHFDLNDECFELHPGDWAVKLPGMGLVVVERDDLVSFLERLLQGAYQR